MEHKNFDVYVDEQGLIHLIMRGMVTKEVIEALKVWTKKCEEVTKSQFEKTGKKVKSLVDLTNLGSEYDGEAIAIVASFAKATDIYTEKSATFGANWTIKFAEDIVIALSGGTNIKAFSNEEEARAWLNL